jgi:hypothetical protein
MFPDFPHPGGGALKACIDGRQYKLDGMFIFIHAPVTVPGNYPDARHIRLDLTGAIRADAATGPVPHGLRAVHRAGHAGNTQGALAAGPGIEQKAFNRFFNRKEQVVQALITDTRKQGMEPDEDILPGIVEHTEPCGIAR